MVQALWNRPWATFSSNCRARFTTDSQGIPAPALYFQSQQKFPKPNHMTGLGGE